MWCGHGDIVLPIYSGQGGRQVDGVGWGWRWMEDGRGEEGKTKKIKKGKKVIP